MAELTKKHILGGIAFMTILFVAITVLCWHLSGSGEEESCQSAFTDTIHHLSTNSPYLPPSESDLVMPPHLNGCKAQQIWLMSRHGTRNPNSETILLMKTSLPKLQAEVLANSNETNLCAKSIADIASWKIRPELDESEENFLVLQGKIELSGMGARFKERFPELFEQAYDNSTYKFKYTKTERAEASAKAFVSSLFPAETQKDVWYPTPVDADPILRFYKSCKKWKDEVDNNPKTKDEQNFFEETDHFKSIFQNVQHRMGFKRNLTFDEIELMYETCGFESAWNFNTKKLSPWCAVFDENDLQALEYSQDVYYYWNHGYGHEISYKQACPPVKDFVNGFQNRIDNPENAPRVIANFAHSGTQLKLLTRLGFFKDDQSLRGDNYDLHKLNRKWRTSKMDKFATNLALILHKCADDYVISGFFQEVPVKLPACDNWYCKFSDFKSKMIDIVEKCDVNSFCTL